MINTVPCLLCPSGLHTFHQTLWNDLMRKNNKKKNPTKTWHLTGITTNWGLKYGFIYCWWEIYFYKINAQKFLQKQENKTRNNFFFLIYSVFSVQYQVEYFLQVWLKIYYVEWGTFLGSMCFCFPFIIKTNSCLKKETVIMVYCW